MDGMYKSQFLLSSLTIFASILFTVRMHRSEAPSDWGWNGVFCVFQISKKERISWIISAVKFFPWSWWICSGVPCWGIQQSNTFLAMVSGLWSLSGNSGSHLVKWSTTTKQYRYSNPESSMDIPQYPLLPIPQGDYWWLVAAELFLQELGFSSSGMASSSAPFLYVQIHMRPEKPLLHPRRSLGITKMA